MGVRAPPPTQAPGSCGGGLSKGRLSGTGCAHGGSTRAPPALTPRVGVTRELGLPESVPGGAGVLQGESHNETEERGCRALGGSLAGWALVGREPGGQEAKEISGGSPGASGGKNLPVSAGDVRDLGRRAPRRRPRQPTPGSLPGASRGQRSPGGHSPWGREESDTTERLSMRVQAEGRSLPAACGRRGGTGGGGRGDGNGLEGAAGPRPAGP